MSTNLLDRNKIKVGVLRGGPSNEYEVSLKTGSNVIKNLSENYIPVDIFISRHGSWHLDGKEKEPARILSLIDVVWNGLHGVYGEDGKVQKILETFKIPFTGSSSLSSALGLNKLYSKAIFKEHEIKTPEFMLLTAKDHTKKRVFEVFQSFPQPSVVKPLRGGSSLGIAIVKSFPEFQNAVENALLHDGTAIVEEYIPGREATCGVLEHQDGNAFALFPVEIVPHDGRGFFDYIAKYERKSDEICPSTFEQKIKDEIQSLALQMHRALGLRHYSRSDFLIHPKRGIYALETNSLPGLTAESLYPKSLNAMDISMSEFTDHVLQLALKS